MCFGRIPNETVEKKSDPSEEAFKIRPLSMHEREERGRCSLCKPALAGSGNHACRLRRVSIDDQDFVHVGLDRARALHQVEDRLQHGRLYLLLVWGSQRHRFLRRGCRSSLTKLSSWKCLEVSRPLRSASSCAASWQLPAGRLFATIDHRTVSSKQTHRHHERLGLRRLR